MTDVVNVLILGLVSASIYAVAASGLVVTYTTSGIFNFAHGAIAMFSAFVYWQLRSPDAWGLPAPVALVLTVFVVRARCSGSSSTGSSCGACTTRRPSPRSSCRSACSLP